MRTLTVAVVLSLSARVAAAQGSDDNHRKVYDATVDSVVAVRSLTAGGERSGSGIVVSKDGLVLVSYAAVPEGAKNIRVWMKGPKLYKAEIVGASRRDELTLLRIKPKGELKPIGFGESSRVKVGEVAYTLGNASNSMINNDQPSLNVGLISGSYKLDAARGPNTQYTGTVFETTAAVNVGMEGAPLLDGSGKMIGFVTLNYSPHRFLGNAIPIDVLRHTVEQLVAGKHASQIKGGGEDGPAETGAAWFGAAVVEQGGKLVIDAVEAGSPAESAGLRKGIVILAAGRKAFKSLAEWTAFAKDLQAGALLTLTVDDDGLKDDVKILLERKK